MASVRFGRLSITEAVRRRVLVKELIAGVRMEAGSMRMSKSSLAASDLVGMSQAAYLTGTSVLVWAICCRRSASCWAF